MLRGVTRAFARQLAKAGRRAPSRAPGERRRQPLSHWRITKNRSGSAFASVNRPTKIVLLSFRLSERLPGLKLRSYPFGQTCGRFIAVTFEHRKMTVPANAAIRKIDMLDVTTRLLKKSSGAMIVEDHP